MRKFVGLAIALVGLVAMTAVAIAGEAGPSPSWPDSRPEASHSPNKASKKKKKVGTKVKITLEPQEDGRHPAVADHRRSRDPAEGHGTQLHQVPDLRHKQARGEWSVGLPEKSKVGTGKLTAGAEPGHRHRSRAR